MADLRFDIPNYDVAMVIFWGQIIDGFYNLDPLLREIPRRVTVHGGMTRNVRGENPLDQPMPEIESVGSLEMDAIRKTDIEALTMFFYEFAQQNLATVKNEMFKGLMEITNATGMSFDAKGQPFSFDHFNDVIERIQIGFDEDGNPILPTAVVSPEMYEKIKNIEPTPEQINRHEEILLRKKKEYYAQKRSRRLSR